MEQIHTQGKKPVTADEFMQMFNALPESLRLIVAAEIKIIHAREEKTA